MDLDPVPPLAALMSLRDAGQAAGFGAVWALFAAAAVLSWRRRALASVLQHPTNHRTDARYHA